MPIKVLIAFCLSGAAALIYEVAWTRSLSLILGSTTYALSTMLGTFMTGLAIGGWIGGKIADRGKNLQLLFGLIELGIGVFGLITVPLIHSLPPLYFKIFKEFHLSPTAFFFFQFILCAGIMLVPTTLMGATFPIVSRKVTSHMEEMGKSVGNAYSFNTFGAIIGSVSAGFVLIPFLGVKAATIAAASLNILAGAGMIALSGARVKKALIVLPILMFGASLAWAMTSEEDKWYINYYKAQSVRSYQSEAMTHESDLVLLNRDFREGRVKLWKDRLGYLIIQISGKIEGTAMTDITNTYLLAYLPIASHPKAESFLTIGLGAGVTLEAAKEHVKNIALVELNEGVVEAIGEFGPEGLLRGVDIEINDARNYLLLTDRRFDIISSEPSYPTDAGTGNLFTKEFFKLAASRLNKDGIYCQWLPYYLLSNDDVTMMLRTFSSVFGHVYLWKVGTSLDLLMVGSNSPFTYTPDEIRERVSRLNTTGMPLSFVLSRTPAQVRELAINEPDMPINTDDRPILEFHATRNLITGVMD